MSTVDEQYARMRVIPLAKVQFESVSEVMDAFANGIITKAEVRLILGLDNPGDALKVGEEA